MKTISIAALALAAALTTMACGTDADHDVATIGLGSNAALPRRDGTIVIDGCVLDTWQKNTLSRPSTKRVAHDIVVLCLVPRYDGVVMPRDPSAQAFLRATVDDLRREGYRVTFGISFTDETGLRYDGAQTARLLADATFRANVVAGMNDAGGFADGIAIDLLNLPNDATSSVTALVREASAAVRPRRPLAVFVPPSVASPSDIPGGDAFDVSAIAPLVDRLHVSTLDFSDPAPGPTIDTGWAVDAVRFARERAASTPLDVSYPLYGTDFGPRGPRSVTWIEAVGRAQAEGARIERGAGGAPFFRWADATGPHETWFDDAESTALALGAWSYDVLPADVGVVFYGLGAEDPTLFDRLAERMP